MLVIYLTDKTAKSNLNTQKVEKVIKVLVINNDKKGGYVYYIASGFPDKRVVIKK